MITADGVPWIDRWTKPTNGVLFDFVLYPAYLQSVVRPGAHLVVTVTINIRKAKTHFSRLIERLRFGEGVTIAKAGMPVVRLVPVDAAAKQRRPGSMKGRIRIGNDFDDPLPPDIAEVFGA